MNVAALCHCDSLHFSFLFLVFQCLNSFSLTPPLSVLPLSLQHVPPFLFSVSLLPPYLPPLPFLPFPLGSGAKVGRQTEANTAQGRAEGDPKAGELIMSMLVF